MIDHVTEPRVECWVRDSAPPGLSTWLDSIISRLNKQVEMQNIAAVDINVWGQRVRCPPRNQANEDDRIDGDIWATYREFKAWAALNGHSLSPAFRRRQQSSLVSEEEYDVIEFPIVCLAIYDGGDLEAVFPCSTDQRTWTVEDALVRLELANSDPPLGEAEGEETAFHAPR